MSSKHSGYFKTIEYIGPKPQKPKKPRIFGGWVILAIGFVAALCFGKPLLGSIWAAERKPSSHQTQDAISQLSLSDKFPSLLAIEALRFSTNQVGYESASKEHLGGNEKSADFIVRSFGKLDVDLKTQLHEDMKENFRLYPQLWSALEPDDSIDHRRVPNLHRFFSRKAESLAPSKEVSSYQVGDIVVWALPNADTHMGIVVPPATGNTSDTPWVVHHPAEGGIRWEKTLFQNQIIGHYRYQAD